jgi:hypothetical protein
MYRAYQTGHSASYSPVSFSCSPCAAAASRSPRSSSCAEPYVTPSTRPGNRVVISCSSHVLPSGSLNDANDEYVPRSGCAPGANAPVSSRWKTSLTSTPWPASSLRAASMSSTTR